MPTRTASRRLTRAKARSVRQTSQVQMFGIPLWQIARGPDLDHGEVHGHARALLAIGDRADGIVAVGGVARGVFALGGVAVGIFAMGGVSISLLASLGGVAISSLWAMGGVALAPKARGGTFLGQARRLIQKSPYPQSEGRSWLSVEQPGSRQPNKRGLPLPKPPKL